jgi:hypothetical protein
MSLAANLERLRAAGQIPHRITEPLTLPEVASWARELPPMRGEGQLEVRGWAIMPPFNDGPLVRLARDVKDLSGLITRGGQLGLVGAVWHSRLHPDQAVFRLWMRPDKAPDPRLPLVPLDIYERDIASEVVIPGLVRYRRGWWFVHTDDEEARS